MRPGNPVQAEPVPGCSHDEDGALPRCGRRRVHLPRPSGGYSHQGEPVPGRSCDEPGRPPVNGRGQFRMRSPVSDRSNYSLNMEVDDASESSDDDVVPVNGKYHLASCAII
ncbi:uncharacterized protein LOC124556155 [Schistocerca americana]|uniref:uncharacterized protein LOC124556155 n=1 Tax=Schistocerca americana TaxID=7009 RepID=UPI001F4F9820|nr:uncharacterized protein LOC124556155 [Schistocerca americana]